MVRTNSTSANETIEVMDVEKLRQDIIDRLKDIDDADTLNELRYLVWKMSYGPFDPDNLTSKQEQLLRATKEAVERGEYLTEEESNKEIDKWLDED